MKNAPELCFATFFPIPRLYAPPDVHLFDLPATGSML
jgi:hypothetical protein